MLDDLFLLSQRYLENNNPPYHRNCWQNNNNDYFKQRLTVLVGQRGIGKTTIIAQYLLSQAAQNNNPLSKNILYVPSDHFLLNNTSLYSIAEQFVQLNGTLIAFDEIHKYTAWSKELKSIYDTFPDLKIIASGSSALEIYKGTHDLTRRAMVVKVPGFSLREYLELQFNISLPFYPLSELLTNQEGIAKQIVENLAQHGQKILPLFNEYLQVGYYPYFWAIKNKDIFLTTLEQNFHTTIEADLTAIYPALTGDSIRKIKQLLSFIAQAVPFTPHWQNIKNVIDVGDVRTLKTYFKYLEDAGLIRMLPKYSQKMHKLESPEKIYLDNPNQLYAIAATAQNVGTVRETFFLSMLANSHSGEICIPLSGDFIVDGVDRVSGTDGSGGAGGKITFEIGGKNKGDSQLRGKRAKRDKKNKGKSEENGEGKNEGNGDENETNERAQNTYVVRDNVERDIGNKIPLWLFGFLY